MLTFNEYINNMDTSDKWDTKIDKKEKLNVYNIPQATQDTFSIQTVRK